MVSDQQQSTHQNQLFTEINRSDMHRYNIFAVMLILM